MGVFLNQLVGRLFGNTRGYYFSSFYNAPFTRRVDIALCEVVRSTKRIKRRLFKKPVLEVDFSKPDSILDEKNKERYILAAKSEKAGSVFGNPYFLIANNFFQLFLSQRLFEVLKSRYNTVGDLMLDLEKNKNKLDVDGITIVYTGNVKTDFLSKGENGSEVTENSPFTESIAGLLYAGSLRDSFSRNIRNGSFSSFLSNCIYGCISEKKLNGQQSNCSNGCKYSKMAFKDLAGLYKITN